MGLRYQNRCVSRLDCTSKGIIDMNGCFIVLAQEDSDDAVLSALGRPIIVMDAREQDKRMHNRLRERQRHSLCSRCCQYLQRT